jgi:hypothetical protein
MTETPAPAVPPKAPNPPEPTPVTPPDQNLVGEAKRLQKKAEKEAADLRARVEELEDRDRTEAERLAKRAEQAERERDELQSRTKNLERGGWVRAAAKDFHDPDDAVLRANLDELEDPKDAERFVKGLAKEKPHLVKPQDEGPANIAQVLNKGERISSTQDPQRQEAAQRQAEWAEGFAAKLKQVVDSGKL